MSYLNDLLSSSLRLKKDGVAVPARSTIDFHGDGVTLADNATTSATDATIPGATSGGGANFAALVVATTNITKSGTQTIDGVSCGVGALVLLVGQTSASENGLWIVQSGAWVRASGMNESSELHPGMLVFIRSGDTYGGVTFQLKSAGPFTIDSTDLVWRSTLDHESGGLVRIGGDADAVAFVDNTGGNAIYVVTDADDTSSIVGAQTLDELAIGIPKRDGTGDNDGGHVTISAADGQDQTGGADNNNGGHVRITVGQKGSGGSGADGEIGALRLLRLVDGATAGQIRLPSPDDWGGGVLVGRNHDNDGNVAYISRDTDDGITIGDSTGGDVVLRSPSGSQQKLHVGSDVVLTAEEGVATFGTGVIVAADTWVRIRRSSDSAGVTNSTTMVDDGVLQFAIGANEEWIVDVTLAISAGAGGGHRETITGPAGATGEIIWNTLASYHAPLGTDLGESGTAISGPTMRVWVVNGGTAGTVKVRYAQYASDASPTVIKAGSYLVATRVA